MAFFLFGPSLVIILICYFFVEKFLFSIVVLLYFVTNVFMNVLSFHFEFLNIYLAVFILILSGLIPTILLQYAFSSHELRLWKLHINIVPGLSWMLFKKLIIMQV